MAKKKNNLGNVLNLLAIVLGVAAVCMLFLTNFVVTDSATGALSENYTGLQTVFGYATENSTYLMFSFMNLLPYLLVIVAVVLLTLKVAKISKCKLLDLISAGCFIVAGILFFFTTNFVILSEGYVDTIKVANLIKTVVSTSLGFGAIIAAISSILAGTFVVVSKFISKK